MNISFIVLVKFSVLVLIFDSPLFSLKMECFLKKLKTSLQACFFQHDFFLFLQFSQVVYIKREQDHSTLSYININ